jgi:tRNA dimethylallyltransferase
MGPTAAGKTALAIELAQNFPFEIISVDSAMVYRGMDIGTAKPTELELELAPHRLINICDPKEIYSVGRFYQDVLQEINDIFAKGKVPLLVGGTMMYFRALQYGLSDLPSANQEVRAELAEQIKLAGLESLYKKLQIIDPQSALVIKATDSQRIKRALEVYILTKKRLSEFKTIFSPKKLPYEVINIGLIPSDRSLLKDKIYKRFQEMLALGFSKEVEKLYTRGDLKQDLPSIRTVGYRQIWQYFAGQTTYAKMLLQVPIATCQLAKRQLTWLRSWSNIELFASENLELFNNIKNLLKKEGF